MWIEGLERGIEPYAYQWDTPERFHQFGKRILIADERGLGKTLEAILCVLSVRDAFPVLVICPAIVKIQWQREIKRFTGYEAEILEGLNPEKRLKMTDAKFLIVNYDILGAKGQHRGHWAYLKRYGAQTVIVDEAHMICNRTATRSIRVKCLCRAGKYPILMTGTPVMQRPDELWHLLHILMPEEPLHQEYFSFARRFCRLEAAPWGKWKYLGPKRLRELNHTLTTNIMIRRRKKDVFGEMKLSRFVLPVPLRKQKEYDKANRDFLGWLSQISVDRARRAMRAAGLAKINYLLQLITKLKRPAVVDWIDDFLETESGKLVVFATHRDTLSGLFQHYPKSAVVVDGSKNYKQKQALVDRFRQDGDIRLLLGNIRACGMGCDGMQDVASALAFVELDWNPAAHDQAEGRIDRHGQKLPPSIWYLVAAGTEEERMCNILQQKRGVASRILDGSNVEGDEAFGIYDQLLLSLGTTN